jgi:hypothetical protein
MANLPNRADDGNAGRGLAPGRTRGLWALAFYALLSLVSHDARREPNLGGALGDVPARTLERTFGYQAYALVPLLACQGRAVWAATRTRLLLRYNAGGAILLVALSTAGGLYNIPMVTPGGATGGIIAAALPGNWRHGRPRCAARHREIWIDARHDGSALSPDFHFLSEPVVLSHSCLRRTQDRWLTMGPAVDDVEKTA